MNVTALFSKDWSPWLAHLIGALTLAAVAWCGYQFAIHPLQNEFVAKSSQLESLEASTRQLGDLRRTYRTLVQEVSQLKLTAGDVREGRLPTEARESEFLQQLEKHTRQAGIRLDDFGQTGVQHGPHYSTLGIRLQFQADYQQACEFFDTIEGLDFVFNNKEFTMIDGDSNQRFRVIWAVDLVFNPNQQTPTNHAFAGVK